MCEKGTSVILPTPDWLWESRAVPENGICVDACMAEELFDAWDMGVRTLGSCCGHGMEPPNIVLVQDQEQVALAHAVLPGWRLYQWQLIPFEPKQVQLDKWWPRQYLEDWGN